MFLRVFLLCACAFLVCHGAQIGITFKQLPDAVKKSFPLPNIDGGFYGNKEIIRLHIIEPERSDRNSTVEVIRNFPYLRNVFIDSKMPLKKLPAFKLVPKLSEIFIVDNQLTNVTNNSFAQTTAEDIVLHNNKIQNVEDRSFGMNVTRVVLSENFISSISPKWFRNPVKLQRLSLSRNKISILQENLLRNFPSLTYLDLRSNKIHTIQDGALVCRNRFHRLDLTDNVITVFSPATFDARCKFGTLDLSFNQLNYLQSELLGRLKVEKLGVAGNPWKCACSDNLHKWMSRNAVVEVFTHGDNIPTCVFSGSVEKVCSELYDNDLYIEFTKYYQFYDRYK